MKKLSNIARACLLLFSCGLPALYGLHQISGNDIWLHLKTGAWIWSHHSVPRTQLYSFWLGPTKEWIDHGWLFQAIIYPIFRLGGLNLLIIFRILLICLILGLFFKVAKNSKRYFIFSALTITISVSAVSSRFFIRPEIFSLLFITSFIFLLKSYKGENRIYCLLPLQILWVNIHGYYIIGPMLVGLFILARIIESKIRLPFSWNEKKLDNKSLPKIIYLFFLLIIAALINPYFLKGALYPFRILGAIISSPLEGHFPFRFVSELESIPIFLIIHGDSLSLLNLTIIIFFFSLLLNIRKADIFDLMVFFTFFGLTIKAGRHIGMLALSLGILALFNFNRAEYYSGSFKKESRRLFKLIHHKALAGVVVVILAINLWFIIKVSLAMATSGYIYNLKGESKSFLFGKDELNYPVGSASFIKENQIQGNIFNFFDNGAYLIFSLYPDSKVFIDGRTELYGDRLLKVVDSILSKPEIFNKLSKDLSIEWVVWPCHHSSKVAIIFKYLYKAKDWKLVFFDGQSSVFAKDLPKYSGLIKNRQVRLEDFCIEPDSRLIKVAREKKFYPFSFTNTAQFFYGIDMPDKALEAIEVAERVSPEGYEIRSLKAVLLAKLGRDKEALDEFFEAARIKPTEPITFKNIGVFYLRRGRPRIAREYFKKGLKLNPGHKELQKCLREIDKYIKK